MPPNSEIIISDTSCLILLNSIDAIDLLKKVADDIYITPTINMEFGKKLPKWIKVKAPKNKNFKEVLELDLDPGEASAIALAFEINNSILILDDLKGRKLAERLHLKYSGTLGLILKATQMGLVDDIDILLNKISATDFRISTTLIETVRQQAKRDS